MTHLDDIVRNHYAKDLPADRLQVLVNATRRADERKRRRWAAAIGVLVAAAMVLIGLLAWPRDILRSEATHVVANHVAAETLVVESADYRVVDAGLPVQVREVSTQRTPGMRLLGGRTCSIAGQPAALLRLTNNQQTFTLYQTPDTEAVAGLFGEVSVDGHSVQFWRESGMLMALISPN